MSDKIIRFDDFKANPSAMALMTHLLNEDPHLLCYFDIVKPYMTFDTEMLMKGYPGRFLSLYETVAANTNVKDYVGIAGIVGWRENRCGANAFITIKPDVLKYFPTAYESALKSVLWWYFKNHNKLFLYMERLDDDAQQEAFVNLHAIVLGSSKIFLHGKVCDTVMYLFERES